MEHFLNRLINLEILNKQEAHAAMERMLETECSYQVAAFLCLLQSRGVIPEEVAGMVSALRQRAQAISLPYPTLDIVGTGGDLANTVNISTGASILAAACGIPVTKHGNRSVSSSCGSADVLEALGIAIEMPPEMVVHALSEVGIAFLFAPYYHPSLKKVAAIRKGLKIPTVFNLLGPLLNPAQPAFSLIGVSSLPTLRLIADTLCLLKDKKRALVFHGNGLDEIAPLGKVTAIEIVGSIINHVDIDPISFGFRTCSLKELQGGDPKTNARLLTDTFLGKKGAIADALILNAGMALWMYGSCGSPQAGVMRAEAVLQEGKAYKILEKWIAFSQSYKHRGLNVS
jgi:anthranilate phosphoribosyltransferase